MSTSCSGSAADVVIGIAYLSIPISVAVCIARAHIKLQATTALASDKDEESMSLLNGIGLGIPSPLWALCLLLELLWLFSGLLQLLRFGGIHDGAGFTVVTMFVCLLCVGTALGIPLIALPTVARFLSNSSEETLEAKEAREDLVKLNEEMAVSKRKLFTFMNFLCHELRNPLFAITSNIEFAQDTITPRSHPDLQESITSINQSAKLMLRLVNDVLDLSKIESGKMELELHEFPLREFFQNMASSMSRQVMASKKKDAAVQFVFHMDDSVPRVAKTDSVRLLQIASNLLSNSKKFTERGAITLSIQVVAWEKKTKPKKQLSRKTSSKRAGNNGSKADHSTGSIREDATAATTSTTVTPNASAADPAVVSGLKSAENFSLSMLRSQIKEQNKKLKDDSKKLKEQGKKKSKRGLDSSSFSSFRRKSSSKVIVVDNSNNDTTNHEEDETEVDPDYDKMTLILTVEDTGIGIEEAHLERIFQPYTQSKLSDFRRHGGTGLGLAIIHNLLEMLGGTVKVTSVVGMGSKFVVRMPIAVPKGLEPVESATTNSVTQQLTTPADIENQQQPSPQAPPPPPVLLERPRDRRGSCGSYAKLPDDLELEYMDESTDQITPLTSHSSLGATIRRLSQHGLSNDSGPGGAISFSAGMLPPERDEAATPQVRNTTNHCSGSPTASSPTGSFRGQAINLGMLPPDRDEAATPQVKNTTSINNHHHHQAYPGQTFRMGMLPPDRDDAATPIARNTGPVYNMHHHNQQQQQFLPQQQDQSHFNPQYHQMNDDYHSGEPYNPHYDNHHHEAEGYPQPMFHHPMHMQQQQQHPMLHHPPGVHHPHLHPDAYNHMHPYPVSAPQHPHMSPVQMALLHHHAPGMMPVRWDANHYTTSDDDEDLTDITESGHDEELGPVQPLFGLVSQQSAVPTPIRPEGAPAINASAGSTQSPTDALLPQPLFGLRKLADEPDQSEKQPNDDGNVNSQNVTPLFGLGTTSASASESDKPGDQQKEKDNEQPGAPEGPKQRQLFGMMIHNNSAPEAPNVQLPSLSSAVQPLETPRPKESEEDVETAKQPTRASALFVPRITPAAEPVSFQLSVQTQSKKPAAPLKPMFQIPPSAPPKMAATGAIPSSTASAPPKTNGLSKFSFPSKTQMVLVVDDNGINRKLIGKMLSYFHLEYQDAEHGKQAVEIMSRSQNFTGDPSAPQFGMVIMDLCMPVMNGFEAIESIRTDLKLLDIPIIALTASAMDDEQQRAMEAGATEFATKPLLRPALHSKCELYLNPPGGSGDGEESKAQDNATLVTAPVQ